MIQNNISVVNTLTTTTTATALNISDTLIDAMGVTFRNITSNGGTAAGIILNNTGSSGGLTVTGLDGVDAGTAPDVGSGGGPSSTKAVARMVTLSPAPAFI